MNLKQWRAENKLSQGEVGEMMGVTAMTVSYWESLGIRNIDIINKLKEISKRKIKDFSAYNELTKD